MALGNDDNPSNGSNQNPFAYVLIPVLGFGLIVAVITCYRYRRKKHRLARLAQDPEYQRQLEEGRRERTQLDRGPNGVIIIAGDRGGGRRGGRSRRLGLGAGVGSREEGLNELGEAPPAYMPNAPKPPSEAGAEHIELTSYSQAMAEAGMSRSPPLYAEELPSSARPEPGSPARGTTSGARDSARSSEEIGGNDATGNATASGARDAARTSEESRGHAPGNATAGGASDSAGTSDETRGDATETTTTTTTTATTEGNTATTSATTDEPTIPQRAVLPSS
ncbi:hypothetical protein F4782DRAFT_526618 [Xylaria castorea]|nr:hypothetical protein F4782DRAFT_526618 [Xylaria castorea]